MSRPLIVRPEAGAEMTGAFDWYEDRAPGLGHDFLRQVDAVFLAIARNPRQFPVVHRGIRRALTRRFPYQVLYVESEDQATVLAVFHVRRDPAHWRKRT
jgi:plasmid stabilization system protein ParE